MVRNKFLRVLLVILGFISLGLGCIGVFLPIIPTAPFLLLTSFCFVRSSEKFNNWFLNSKIYKKHLENFAKDRVMTLKGELILLIGVSLMLLTSMYFINNVTMTIVFICLIFFKYLYFVLQVRPISKDEYEYIRLKREKEVVESC